MMKTGYKLFSVFLLTFLVSLCSIVIADDGYNEAYGVKMKLAPDGSKWQIEDAGDKMLYIGDKVQVVVPTRVTGYRVRTQIDYKEKVKVGWFEGWRFWSHWEWEGREDKPKPANVYVSIKRDYICRVNINGTLKNINDETAFFIVKHEQALRSIVENDAGLFGLTRLVLNGSQPTDKNGDCNEAIQELINVVVKKPKTKDHKEHNPPHSREILPIDLNGNLDSYTVTITVFRPKQPSTNP